MKTEQIFNIRFVVPPGIVIFLLFVFAPEEFTDLVGIYAGGFNLLLSITGIIVLGFVVSSLTDFWIVGILKGRKNMYHYDFKKIFKIEKNFDKKYERNAIELSTWIAYDKENKSDKSSIPDQISKRWNIAMANYNCLFAIIITWIIIWVLPHTKYWPDSFFVDVILSAILIIIFWQNGRRARKSVLQMDDLLASRVEINS